ncbi:universal stress protein [Deinococcus sp. NW-56]|uniref:universal stress protein n=1 Tax=Deinococcus sp. NW-56 TaxID=2080419 RepID=UPI000CF50559|nr:universal stress protein [Deinococcus sp. NW-56]
MPRILVTTDGSSLGHQALAHADALARALGADLSVLYVQPDPLPTVAEAYAYVPENAVQEQEEAMLALRDELQARLPHADLRLERASGRPVPRLILEAARTLEADLIVMSTHGRSGLSRALLGSVAEAVTHHAPVPVLLVRDGQAVPSWAAVQSGGAIASR